MPPDSVRCTRGLQLKLATFGKIQRRSAIIHRTVRCTPDSVRCSKEERPQELASFGNLQRLLCYNSPDMSGVHRTVRCNHGTMAISAPTATCSAFIARQRAQMSGVPILAHRTLNSTCPVRHQTSRRARSQNSNGRNPTALVTWLGHRTCPVCTGLSGASSVQRLFRRQRLPAMHLMRAQCAQKAGAPILAHQIGRAHV